MHQSPDNLDLAFAGVYSNLSRHDAPAPQSARAHCEQPLSERWTLDLNLTRYFYPDTRAPAYLGYSEVITTLTLDQRWWTMRVWSDDVFATGQRGVYIEAGAKFPLSDAFRIGTIAGHYDLDDAYTTSDHRAQLSAIRTIGKVDLRASGHWTGGDAERIFPGVAGSRVEIAATLNF